MTKVQIKNIFRKLSRLAIALVIIVMALIVAGLVILNLPSTKNYIAEKAIEQLNKEFNTEISAKSTEIDFFGDVILNEVAVQDHHHLDFIQIKKLKASIDLFGIVSSLGNNKLSFNHIQLEEPTVNVITYKGESQDNFLNFIDKFDDGKPSEKPSTFEFLSEIDVLNGKLKIINQNLKDSIWLDAKNVNIAINQLNTKGSNVSLDLVKFNFDAIKNKEQYHVNQLGAEFIYSKKAMKFKNLIFETQSSSVFGNLEFTYEDPSQLSDFSNKVIWNADIIPNSTIGGKDIRYFSSDWDSDAVYQIKSKATGTLNNLTLTSTQLASDSNYISAEKLSLKDILNDNYFVDIKNTSIQTSNSKLKSILPTFISENLKDYASPFGNINYKGDFSINPSKLIIDGNLISALGNAKVKGKLANYSETNPTYDATINASKLNLSSFIGDETVQSFSGIISVKGKGFDSKKMNLDFDANLSSIHIANYFLQNQKVKGYIANEKLTAFLDSNDPKAKVDANIALDFSKEKLKLDADGTIHALDSYYFGITNIKGETISSNFNVNTSFSSLNDLEATANINSFILNSPINSIIINDLDLDTHLTESGRYLHVDSPSNINLTIDGKYNLGDLPDTFINGFGGMLVGYKPKKTYKNQNYTFDLEIEDSFLELFIKDISFNSGTKINGSYQGEGNVFDLHLYSPKFSYQNISSENLKVDINTSNYDNKLKLTSDIVSVSDNFVRNASILATKQNKDSVLVNTNFYIDKAQKSPFNINFYQTRKNDNFFFGIVNSTFVINDTNWEINPNDNPEIAQGSYNIKTGEINLNDLIIQSQDAELKIDGTYKSLEDIQAQANFKNIALERFIPKDKLGDIKIEGIADGSVNIDVLGGDIRPLSNLQIKQVKINDVLVGDLNSNLFFNEEKKSLEIDAKISNEKVDNLSLKGSINDYYNNPKLDINVAFNDLKTNFLEAFLSGVLSNISGYANREVQLGGTLTNPNYNGSLFISDFGFIVDYLGVEYKFKEEQEVLVYSLDEKPMNIGNFYIQPADFYSVGRSQKRTGSVSGLIQTRGFLTWFLNLDFESDNLMVLNTNYKQNDLFYGTVFANGNFYLHGLTDELSISADATALEGSKLVLNTGATADVEDASKILVFKKPKNEENTQEKKANSNSDFGMNLDFRVRVDEKTEINVVLDEVTRDELVARGNSTDIIRFEMFPNGKMEMNGKYEVKYGSKYHFRTLLDKVFIIESGSTITWNGDPYDADLDITASQTKQVSNAGDFLQMSNVPIIPVDLKVLITDKLSKPKINFKVQAPKAPQNVKEELNAKFTNNQELEKNQFGVLLLTSKFLTDNGGVTGVQSSAYEVAIRQLVNFLNNISSDVQFDLGITEADQLSQTDSRLNAGLSLNVNSRVKVKGNVGVPFGSGATGNNQLTAEGELEWDISKRNDNSLLIRGFSRPTSFGLENYNLGVSQLQSYGGGIVYRKSFDSFREFFGLSPKKEQDSIQVQK